MSFPFRERANLRDRLRGQRDEILKEFREEFNQDRKLFENPNWGSSPAGFQQPTFSRNFPFDDDDDLMQGRRSGKLQAHLDKLSARHPELAEGLFGWREEAAGDKRKREREERDREREERERERDERESEKEGGLGAGSRLRNTVPDMHQQSDRDEDDRGPRARSAPPQPFQPQPQQPQPTVRHIPIYVEGRDEPLLPKEALDQQQKPAAAQSKPVPMAAPPCVTKPPASAPEEPVPLPMPAPEVPVPMPAPPAPSTPTSVQQEEEQPQQQVQEEEKDAIHRVEVVEKEVASLEERVNAFGGSSKADKEYIYLDEMLTRNLLKLDDIDTEGRDEVRAARKNAIRSIQRCISILEAKTEPKNDSQ